VKKANAVLSWVLALSIIALIAAEEHARRTWRDRASTAQIGLARATLEISALKWLNASAIKHNEQAFQGYLKASGDHIKQPERSGQ